VNGRMTRRPTGETKLIKVCRAGRTVLQNALTGKANTPRMGAFRNTSSCQCGTRNEDPLPISERFPPNKFRQAGSDNLRDKAGRDGPPSFGYTDDAAADWPRREHLRKTNLSLSKARAHHAALAMQEILGLPASAIEKRRSRGPLTRLPSNENGTGTEA